MHKWCLAACDRERAAYSTGVWLLPLLSLSYCCGVVCVFDSCI